MVKHEPVNIVTNQILRDERIERRIQEMNMERVLYTMVLIGAIFFLMGILW